VLYQGTKLANVLLVVCALSPAAAWAQVAPLGAPAQGTDRTERAPLQLALDESAALLLTTQPTTPPPPPPPPERGRRRPSMVGYIEDPTIGSRIRLRFDTARGNEVPDRAEFFYAKCGCYQQDPEPFFDPEAPGPGPGVPTELNFQQFYIFGEYALQDRFSLFAELPIRAIQPQGFFDFGAQYAPFPDSSGIADLKVGAKAALVANEYRDLTVQLRVSMPTGDAAEGLGSDFWSIEPTLLYQENITERVRFEAQIGNWHPLGGAAGAASPDDFSGDVLFYGFGPSFDVVSTDRFRFSPVVELVGWRVLSGFQTRCDAAGCGLVSEDFEADGTNIVNLKVGARTTFAERSSLYVGYGWNLTDAHWYDNILRFEYRYGF
jgi:hypothetical protein